MEIELREVTVSYGSKVVVHELSSTVQQGAWVAPIGPNGAGKSTLLRAMAALLPFCGTVRIGGESISDCSRRQVARLVAFVPQRPVLPSLMTVADYVSLGRTPHVSYFGSEKRHDKEVVADVLARLSLEPLAARCLSQISGGEAQRAVLGRALAQETPIVILDEPTSSLDLGHQQQVLELVDELRAERGLTVVSAMHDLTLAGQFADELWLINGGTLAARGTASEVLTEALVHAHYGAAVSVSNDVDGGVLVVPRRRRRDG